MKDEDTLYNIEMQVTNNKDLGKRSRYYQACIDLHSLEKGVTYKQMKKSYIVFICAFDPFQENMAKYEFRSYCVDNKDIELEDDAVRVFLKYVNGEKTNNKFVEELEEIVKGIKGNREWRKEYMNLYMRELELKEESYEKGIQVGVQTGIQQGIQQGLKQGVQQGLKQGVQQGIKQGVEEGIRNTIMILKGIHLPIEEIINKVSEQFNISKKEVEKYL